jgi:hypothetical protein
VKLLCSEADSLRAGARQGMTSAGGAEFSKCYRGSLIALPQHDRQGCVASCIGVIGICTLRHEFRQKFHPAEQRCEG